MDKKSKPRDLSSLIFLIVGGLFVVFSTYQKVNIENSDFSGRNEPPSHYNPMVTPTPHPQIAFESDSRTSFVTKSPVSNEEYHFFCQQSGYRSHQEKSCADKTWEYPDGRGKLESWREAPSAPVTFLTQADCQAYVEWYNARNGFSEEHAFRLPLAEELTALQEAHPELFHPQIWEWTNQNSKDFGESLSNSYKTRWEAGGRVQHVQSQMLEVAEASNTGFRLIRC